MPSAMSTQVHTCELDMPSATPTLGGWIPDDVAVADHGGRKYKVPGAEGPGMPSAMPMQVHTLESDMPSATPIQFRTRGPGMPSATPTIGGWIREGVAVVDHGGLDFLRLLVPTGRARV